MNYTLLTLEQGCANDGSGNALRHSEKVESDPIVPRDGKKT